MKMFPNFFITLLLLFFSVEVIAQESYDDDSITTFTDSVCVDSLTVNELPYPQRAVQKLDELMQNKMFETSQVGLMVYDLDADSALYARNERQLMRPASTMKLLTAIAFLDRLGKNYRFRTSVSYTGKIDSVTLRGDIYVKGGMDPSLGNYDLDCITEEIAKLKIDTIMGNIIADR